MMQPRQVLGETTKRPSLGLFSVVRATYPHIGKTSSIAVTVDLL
jgi:hypothetical protein